MRRWILSLAVLFGSAGPGWANGRPGTVALAVTGIPEGSHPAIRQYVAAELASNLEGPLRTVYPSGQWFWQPSDYELWVEVEFDRYHSGREKRVLFPWAAARYAYSTDASGRVSIRSSAADSLLAVVPFSFRWQWPVFYQFPGIDPDAAGVQLSAPRAQLLEAEALRALGLDIARAVGRALKKAGRHAS